MKLLIFCVAMAAAVPAHAESVKFPVKARIINLTLMPTKQAIAFCDRRNLECPAIRNKAEKEESYEARWVENTTKVIRF